MCLIYIICGGKMLLLGALLYASFLASRAGFLYVPACKA